MRQALLLGLSPFVCASPLAAQNEILIAEGDVIPNVGTVADVVEVVVADGGHWAATVRIEGMPSFELVLLQNGSVLLTPGDPLPGSTLGEVYSRAAGLDLADDGTLTWIDNKILGSSSPARTVFRDLTPLLKVGELPVGPDLAGSGPWKGFFAAAQDDDGTLVVSAAADQASGPFQDDLVIRIPLGTVGADAEVIAAEGEDILEPGNQILGVESWAYALAAGAGSAYYQLNTLDADGLFRDGTPLALEDETSPLFGFEWASFVRHAVAANASGDFAFSGRVLGQAGFEDFVVNDGALVASTGETLPAIAPFEIESLGVGTIGRGPVRIDDAGRMVFFAQWNDSDPAIDSGLFRDQQLVAREGVTRVDGVAISSFTESEDGLSAPVFSVTGDGDSIAARVVLEDGRSAAVRLQLDPKTEAIPGCSGNTAELTVQLAAPGTSILAILANAQSMTAMGLVGLSTGPALPGSPCGVDLPGLGELLIDTAPGALITLVPTLFPAGLPSSPAILGVVPDDLGLVGLELFLQGAWIDGVDPEPVRLSNGVKLTLGI